MHGRNPTSAVDILIAEDDDLMRSSLCSLLEREGFRCAEADNGREALVVARRHSPQCVFIDLGIPELDGFTVTRHLRSDPLTRDAHIHCLTGRQDDSSRQQAQEAGCEMYLTKPVDVNRILEVVHRQVTPAQLEWVSGLNLTQAQELLDWLENHGCTRLAMQCRGEAGFAVRCACPPGLKLNRDEWGAVHLLPA
jgi:CheY-like chemotaxis protein